MHFNALLELCKGKKTNVEPKRSQNLDRVVQAQESSTINAERFFFLKIKIPVALVLRYLSRSNNRSPRSSFLKLLVNIHLIQLKTKILYIKENSRENQNFPKRIQKEKN